MAVGLSVFLLSVALFMGVLYQYFGDQITGELENEAWLVARGVESMGMDYFDGLQSSSRITWVGEDGTVLYDSVADASTMENHADREEIREAMNGSRGTAQRQSATLSEKTFYVARRLEDGSVIRLASAQYTVVVLLVSMVQPLLIILVLSLILAAVLANRLSKGIIRPILDLDLEHPEECDTYDELSPLLTRIRRQNDTIRGQMDQLRQRQQEFAALTENMTEGFVLLDQKGHVLSYNSGALRLLGAIPPGGEANVLTLDRTDAFRRVVEQVLDGVRGQTRLDRQGRCVHLLADPVFREGAVSGAVLVLLDVTEREQGERMRREFTANVSHELKTPMTTIAGYTDGILDGTIPPENERQYLQIISDESRRLSRLVRRMLDVSQLQAIDPLREGKHFDICESMRRVLISMERKITDRNLDVEADIPEEPILVLGDKDMITQVIYNLLENATKFAREGSTLYLGVTTIDGKARVTVRNEGDTIPAEELPLLFERFHKSDKSRSEDKDGYGLGLYIVKTILEQHKEKISVTSEDGVTAFSFSLATE